MRGTSSAEHTGQEAFKYYYSILMQHCPWNVSREGFWIAEKCMVDPANRVMKILFVAPQCNSVCISSAAIKVEITFAKKKQMTLQTAFGFVDLSHVLLLLLCKHASHCNCLLLHNFAIHFLMTAFFYVVIFFNYNLFYLTLCKNIHFLNSTFSNHLSINASIFSTPSLNYY